MRVWRFQHVTVIEQNIEIGFSLIISIYEVVYITVTDLHAGYAATRWTDCCQSWQNVRFWISGNRSSDNAQLSILQVSKGGEVFLHFTL